jgi:hypothetical protein
MPDSTLLDRYAQARKDAAAAEDAAKDARRARADAERALLDAMADEGTTSAGTDQFTVSVSRKLRPSVTGDKAAACAFLADDPSFRDITKVDVNLQTLGSLIRELAAKHPDQDPMDLLPPGARDHIQIYEQYALNFRSK